MAMTIADIRHYQRTCPGLLENVAQVDTGIDFAGIWQHRLRKWPDYSGGESCPMPWSLRDDGLNW